MKNTTTIIIVAALLITAGCGSERRDTPMTALEPTDGIVSRGEVAFMRECNQCHPGGCGGLAPAINDKPLPKTLIKTQIRAGLGAMPSFSAKQLPDEDVDAIIAYLKALRSIHDRSSDAVASR